jgi:hypothetical protein
MTEIMAWQSRQAFLLDQLALLHLPAAALGTCRQADIMVDTNGIMETVHRQMQRVRQTMASLANNQREEHR